MRQTFRKEIDLGLAVDTSPSMAEEFCGLRVFKLHKKATKRQVGRYSITSL